MDLTRRNIGKLRRLQVKHRKQYFKPSLDRTEDVSGNARQGKRTANLCPFLGIIAYKLLFRTFRLAEVST